MKTQGQNFTTRLAHRSLRFLLCLLFSICLAPLLCHAQTDVEITLKNSFIEKYKDRATMKGALS